MSHPSIRVLGDWARDRLRCFLWLPLLLTTLPASAYLEETSYVYSVWYDGKRIGEHTFVIKQSPNATHVQSEARMEFRLLFVPVYRYQHRAEEHWQDGCLARLTAETNDNGTRFAVRAQAGPEGLLVEQGTNPGSPELMPVDCAATFAYWDLDLLQTGSLLNPQSGKLARAELTSQGADTVGGSKANAYMLEADGLSPIRLWYRDSDGLWLQLETVRDGATLRYRFEGPGPSALLAKGQEFG